MHHWVFLEGDLLGSMQSLQTVNVLCANKSIARGSFQNDIKDYSKNVHSDVLSHRKPKTRTTKVSKGETVCINDNKSIQRNAMQVS